MLGVSGTLVIEALDPVREVACVVSVKARLELLPLWSMDGTGGRRLVFMGTLDPAAMGISLPRIGLLMVGVHKGGAVTMYGLGACVVLDETPP